MPMVQYLCKNVASGKCDGAMVQDKKLGPPIKCSNCGGSIDGTLYTVIDTGGWESDSDDSAIDSDDDFYVADPKEPRPAWNKGRREEITNRQTKRGRLICRICDKPIKVNAAGKEEWHSKSGKFHQTLPPIDHFGGKDIPLSITGGVPNVTGDYAQRQDRLRSSLAHQSKKIIKQKEIERAVYNASPLRITHMKCNCSRPKYKK